VFKTIPDKCKKGNIPTEEKIEKIVQTMENYRSHITELMELLQPSTPPEVRSQREQEVTVIRRVLCRAFRKSQSYMIKAQLWMNLQEDEKLQELDKKGRRSKHCSAGT
jgi:hypothetical protein